MKEAVQQKKRITLAALLLGLQVLLLAGVFKFNLNINIIITVLEGTVLLLIGERLVKYEQTSQGHPYVMFTLTSLALMGLALYILVHADYTESVGYFKWLKGIWKKGDQYLDYQAGTSMMIIYIIVMGVYMPTTGKLVKRNIAAWLPMMGAMIVGTGMSVFLKPGFNHATRTFTVFIAGGSLAMYMIYSMVQNNDDRIMIYVRKKQYVLLYLIQLIIVTGIGVSLPDVQELPGTRWFHHVINTLKTKTDISQWIPYEYNLSSDIPSSEAVLFEVQASRALYLRDVAYNNYINGTWTLEEDENEQNIPFKPEYLEAEYEQEKYFLDEIVWLNSQDKQILPEYSWLRNYERSVVTQDSYTILQNPINKINYFTPNGLRKIVDSRASQIYYYYSLNNCYYYSNRLTEPSGYQVFYCDHKPKVGSREYLFLRKMNGEKWEQLFNQVTSLRKEHGLSYGAVPAILRTYTPLVQYKNAQQNFLQIPAELKSTLRQYTRQITDGEESDWGQAQAIEQYLKQNYTYSLRGKKTSKDRVLNFLFDAREGACQDFATSMTLMCRSIGLPAKYVTGYLADEKDETSGNYVVKEKDAHAFVEVYIAGYGWMSFDPTPAEVKAKDEEIRQDISIVDIFNMVIIVLIVVLLFTLSGNGRKLLTEKLWQLRHIWTGPDDKIRHMMAVAVSLLDAKGRGKKKYETLSQYAERMKTQQIDITRLVQIYEKQVYGLTKTTQEDLKEAASVYKTLKKQLKKNDN